MVIRHKDGELILDFGKEFKKLRKAIKKMNAAVEKFYNEVKASYDSLTSSVDNFAGDLTNLGKQMEELKNSATGNLSPEDQDKLNTLSDGLNNLAVRAKQVADQTPDLPNPPTT